MQHYPRSFASLLLACIFNMVACGGSTSPAKAREVRRFLEAQGTAAIAAQAVLAGVVADRTLPVAPSVARKLPAE